MGWRFYRNVVPLGLVFIIHGVQASSEAPQSYDDPDFVVKMVCVAAVFGTFIVGHLIQKAEAKLRSTQS